MFLVQKQRIKYYAVIIAHFHVILLITCVHKGIFYYNIVIPIVVIFHNQVQVLPEDLFLNYAIYRVDLQFCLSLTISFIGILNIHVGKLSPVRIKQLHIFDKLKINP